MKQKSNFKEMSLVDDTFNSMLNNQPPLNTNTNNVWIKNPSVNDNNISSSSLIPQTNRLVNTTPLKTELTQSHQSVEKSLNPKHVYNSSVINKGSMTELPQRTSFGTQIETPEVVNSSCQTKFNQKIDQGSMTYDKDFFPISSAPSSSQLKAQDNECMECESGDYSPVSNDPNITKFFIL